MQGLMMDEPLLISSLIKHAAMNYADKGVVSRETDGTLVRLTYREVEARARSLAGWLGALGITSGDKVGTIAWNTHRHLELYYASSGMGAICHTVNPRLAPEDVAFILRDAGTKIVFLDDTFIPLVEAVAAEDTPVETWVIMTGSGTKPNGYFLDYETGLGTVTAITDWPEFEENTAAGLCYTSGTTGKPKGVLYSHRSTVLHALASAAPNVLDIAERDIVMPVVPMFHVNAWGIPHIAPMSGATIVMPGAALDGENLAALMQEEKVTFAAGVPTIWHGLMEHLKTSSMRLPLLERCIVGGSALPEVMTRYFEDEQDIAMYQGWGMTETSPICTISKLSGSDAKLSRDEQVRKKARQGKAVFPIQMKILSDDGNRLGWDDRTCGELFVRGPWIAKTYAGFEEDKILIDGWFATGDIVKIDQTGSVKITDRAKDIIKSGGEWISSIELEDIALSHNGVGQVAVIGVPDSKWGERPMMIYVPADINPVNDKALHAFLSERLPKWQLPEHYRTVDALPLGATGKILKTKLRELFEEGVS
ncbi:MAG: long-chain fatty acid--CoA ligase [Kordiimonadaceae bacterium]|nr:long-chain fatty acid--CoA ligase [Kordiimonadaceae bacterium]